MEENDADEFHPVRRTSTVAQTTPNAPRHVPDLPPVPITGVALAFGEQLLQYGSYLTELGSRILEKPPPHSILSEMKLDSDPITGKRVALVGYCDGYPMTSDNCDCTWRSDNGKLVGRGFGFRPTMDHVGSALHVDIVHSSGGRAHLSSTVVLPDGKIATHALNFMQGEKVFR